MAHIHEKIDFTVEVFIVHNNKVLLRKHDKYKFWLSVGGHVELDEDPNQAALREAKEEVGLDVDLVSNVELPEGEAENYEELLPPRFMNRHRINENHEHITLTYFAISDTDQLILEKESDECKWFTVDELDEAQYGLKDSIKFYAKKALEEVC